MGERWLPIKGAATNTARAPGARWIVALVAALLALLLLAACSGDDGAAQEDEVQEVTAFVGDLAASASASGKVLPQQAAAVAVSAPGRVVAVPVRSGDAVAAGDVLVQLETADLELAVAGAEQDLALQEANLAQLQEEPLPEEVAAAEAAVTSAEASLEALRAGPRAEEIAAAEANVRAAQAGVWSSSAQLAQTRESGASTADIARARAQLAAAQLDLLRAQDANEANPVIETHEAMLDAQEAVAIAQAQLDAALAGPNDASVSAAQASVGAAAAQQDAREADLAQLQAGPSETQVSNAVLSLAQAQASLASLQEGPTAEAVRTARARVTQAEVALADAAAALAEATVRAPFAGVVTAVYVSPGEWAGGVVADVMAQDSLEVVLTVDEADVGALAPGQVAIVTLETWPDETIDSEVVSIAPAARAEDSALVSYELHLSLAATGLPVRAGMTASAQLLTAQREGVLLVPNQAIIADREAGRYYVNLISGAGEEERVERVEVTIGLRDGENTQIVSGLAAGDRLQVGNNLPVIVPGDGGGPFSGQ